MLQDESLALLRTGAPEGDKGVCSHSKESCTSHLSIAKIGSPTVCRHAVKLRSEARLDSDTNRHMQDARAADKLLHLAHQA